MTTQLETHDRCHRDPAFLAKLGGELARPDFRYEVAEPVAYCFACVGRMLEPEVSDRDPDARLVRRLAIAVAQHRDLAVGVDLQELGLVVVAAHAAGAHVDVADLEVVEVEAELADQDDDAGARRRARARIQDGFHARLDDRTPSSPPTRCAA
ncbi:MAG TPA: hypothetical protein VH143_28245 [Kofleriaceae bacterium]|nr:hypothetical protein [Kofleriaceae bacterium]